MPIGATSDYNTYSYDKKPDCYDSLQGAGAFVADNTTTNYANIFQAKEHNVDTSNVSIWT